MLHITAPGVDLPLFDVASTRRIEQQALSSFAPYTLMQRAGESLARLALALAPHAQRFFIAAGAGNNGGDGLEAAAVLQGWGKAVDVLLVTSPERLIGDARTAHARALAAGVRIASGGQRPGPALGPHDLAIDALLGIGVRRAPEGAIAQAIADLNRLPCPVLAADLPSGLSPETGQALGPACVRAQHTLTMLTLKPGLFTAAGRDQAGSVWLASLGVNAPVAQACAWLAGAPAARSARRHAAHKGSFGDVAVVGGTAGMGGAALLAARAAHAAGAGRVFVQLLDPAGLGQDSGRPELMLRPQWTQQASPVLLGTSTVVCGCGGGNTVGEVLARVLSRAGRLVLDADALNAVAADPALQALLSGRASRDLPTVITPHPLEAARLLGIDSHQVQADRLAAARALADRLNCVVVLKGSGTVLAQSGRMPRINPTGSASLASAGTGDVLAGWLGGEWSQYRDTASDPAGFEAAVRSVWLHGRAADLSKRRVMRASELIEAMSASADT
jgi:hydroxyethylthiazole kinase-like uncharacterized protein yjeF